MPKVNKRMFNNKLSKINHNKVKLKIIQQNLVQIPFKNLTIKTNLHQQANSNNNNLMVIIKSPNKISMKNKSNQY